jgi:hypothetical protein
MQPSPDHRGLGLRSNSYRGHLWVHFRCGPVTRSPPRGRLCRLASSASFPSRRQPKLRGSDSCPGGTHLPLNTPAFRWSHYGPEIQSVVKTLATKGSPAGPYTGEVPRALDLFRFVLIAVAGWMNQQQRQMIEYLREENRVLREQLGNTVCGSTTASAVASPPKRKDWDANCWLSSPRSSRPRRCWPGIANCPSRKSYR